MKKAFIKLLDNADIDGGLIALIVVCLVIGLLAMANS